MIYFIDYDHWFGAADSLLQQRVSRRRDNGKGRSGLKLKSGLQLVKNYRVVHRESEYNFLGVKCCFDFPVFP